MGYYVSTDDRICSSGHDLALHGVYKRPENKLRCRRCHLDDLARSRKRLLALREYPYQLVTEREKRNFWRKVDKSAPNGCWEWAGATMVANPPWPHEYGVVQVACCARLAHRVSYAIVHGKIPDGFVIDHLCRNTKCVNPDHLEAVTQRENIARGIAPVGKPGNRNWQRLARSGAAERQHKRIHAD